MRALLLALVLIGLFLAAKFGQERWTHRLVRERELALTHPGTLQPAAEGWSMLVVGRPSGSEPLPYPEHGWASPELDPDDSDAAIPLAAEADPSSVSGEQHAPDFVYRVQQGDTLGKICQGHYGSARRTLVESIATYNGLASPDAIRQGTLLYLPDAEGL